MLQVRWKLGEYLKENGLTAYKLARALPDVREPTVYRLASAKAPRSVNLDLLGRVLSGLSQLQGRRVEVGEVLEVQQERREACADFSKRFNRRPLPKPLTEGKTFDSTQVVRELRGRE